MKTLLILCFFLTTATFAQELKLGDPAPLFIVKTHEGKYFDLRSRKGQWTVLYFYPKAGTSNCTQQAMAFRDELGKFQKMGAQVYGISTDSVEVQAKFKKDLDLNFILLADSDTAVTKLYGTKLFFLNYSKRWSYIIDPNLTLRFIEKNVEAKEDAKHLLEKLIELKKE